MPVVMSRFSKNLGGDVFGAEDGHAMLGNGADLTELLVGERL